MKKSVISLIIACVMIFMCTACNISTISQQDTTEFKKLLPKEQVAIIHLENLKMFLDENSENIANAFSTNYLDFYRSQNGKKADVDKSYFEKWFKTKNYEACKKKKLEELVDVNKKQVYSYNELMKLNLSAVAVDNNVGFKYEEEDILIKFPKKEKSPMLNGWNGVYRKENGHWKIIAGNF